MARVGGADNREQPGGNARPGDLAALGGATRGQDSSNARQLLEDAVVILRRTLPRTTLRQRSQTMLYKKSVLEGLDGLVLTAGVGENSAEIRRRICRASAWLWIDFDLDANDRRW